MPCMPQETMTATYGGSRSKRWLRACMFHGIRWSDGSTPETFVRSTWAADGVRSHAALRGGSVPRAWRTFSIPGQTGHQCPLRHGRRGADPLTSSSSSSSIWRNRCSRLSRLRRSKKFGPHVVHDRPEPIQRDFLDVDARHAGDCVAHDAVDSVLVPHFVSPGSEGMSERVEADAFSLQAQFPKEDSELLANGINVDHLLDDPIIAIMHILADPCFAGTREKQQSLSVLVGRFGSCLQ
jgi:hypothetical protein